MQHPFSEENFSELLYAVELVKIEGGEAKREYMEVVNSYFSQLKEKLNSDTSFRFTSEVSSLKIRPSKFFVAAGFSVVSCFFLLLCSFFKWLWILLMVYRSGQTVLFRCILQCRGR